MYFFLLILAMFCYSLQDAFMAHFARKIESLSMSVYRNLSLGISMFVVFLFVPWQDVYSFAPKQMLVLGFSSFCGSLAVTLFSLSSKTLPVGIGAGIRVTANTLMMVLIGFILFGEILNKWELLVILFVILGILLLTMQKIDVKHLIHGNPLKGFIYSIIGGFCAAFAFSFMSEAARNENPLVVAYFWELFIGIFALIIGIFRYLFFKIKIEKISKKTFLHILLGATPTVVGTVSFTIAIRHVPIGIAGAFLALDVLMLSLFGVFMFKEKLQPLQLLGIVMVVLSVVILKIIGV